ncbi:MAG: hypothetical protein IID53_02420 [Proteobacteria bacterium]|nr:hypothetical protein [Pseudomonadota bacterium]
MSDAGEIEVAWIGPQRVPVWPESLELFRFDKDVFFTINSDLVELQQPLIDAILEAESKKLDPEDRQSPGQGGNKVRDLHSLGVPFFDLLNERARRLFMHVTGNKTAVVDDCWANVYRDGYYAMPHSHKRSIASIVFALDNGYEDDAKDDVLNGVLSFADPRMPRCCPGKPGYVSAHVIVRREPPGRMIIFPSHYTHLVTPYHGRRPRISIAWNLNPHKVAGEVVHDGRL